MEDLERPAVVCLCGSLRFQRLFQSERRRLTALGVIVLGPEPIDGELTPATRAALGELHLRRIDLADEIRVVSEGGYVGRATRREIAYARAAGKVVSAVEPDLDLELDGEAATSAHAGRSGVVERLEGKRAMAVVDRLSQAYTGGPYAIRSGLVAFVVEPQAWWARDYSAQ